MPEAAHCVGNSLIICQEMDPTTAFNSTAFIRLVEGAIKVSNARHGNIFEAL